MENKRIKKKDYTYKPTENQAETLRNNITGNLILAVKDIDTDIQYKIPIKKKVNNKGEYFINPKINLQVLKNKTLSKTTINRLIKGFKIEFKQLDRKTRNTTPIQMAIMNKDNINVRLLNPNIRWRFHIRWSGTDEDRLIDPIANFNFNGSISQLEERIKNYINDVFHWIPDEGAELELIEPIQFIDTNNIISMFNFFRVEKDNEQYYIEKKAKYAQLKNLFNEDIKAVENPANENCVIYYFNDMFKRKQRKIYKIITEKLKELDDKNKTIYLNDLKELLNDEDITIYIYSVCGLEYSKYSSNYTEKSKLETIILYIEDNHLYIVKSLKHKNHLTRKSISNLENINIKFDNKLDEISLLEATCFHLEEKDNNINYMMVKDNELITNKDNIGIINKFIEKLGFNKKLLKCNTANFITKIKDKYEINNFSLFPFDINCQSVIMFKNNDIEQDKNDKNLLNIDKNKCFSNALYDAEFIPTFNIFTDIKREYKQDEELIDTNLYYIEIDKPNEIYFNNGYWFGWFIKKYGGLKHINIKFVFECDTVKKENMNYNPYKVLINDLYSMAESDEEIKFIKDSINKFIGQMINSEDKNISFKENMKCLKTNDLKLIFKSDIEKYEEVNEKGEKIKFNYDNIKYDETLKVMTMKENFGYTNDPNNKDIWWTWDIKSKINNNMGCDNKPLHILITNISQSYIIDTLDKIKTIKGDKPLNKNDIIEINTDCIYIKNSNKYNFEFIKVNNNFDGWKLEKGYKEKQIINSNFNENNILECKYFFNDNNNVYNFNLEYAGGGKTYRIKQIINEKLKENKNYSYVILSSFNDFITDYRKNGLNAFTIAHYIFHNNNIKEKNIYIDEWGVCSLQENLFLFRHSNKIFNFYGDTQQLKPVNSKKINLEFIKSIANEYNTEWTNKRNTFSNEFYDELIKEKDIKEINKIVSKYNTPITQADKIIAFYNDTVEKYNEKLLTYHNKQFNNELISLNIPVINTENKLTVKNIKTNENEYIYNRHSFNIIDKIDDNFIIDDDINKYIIDKDNLLKYFKVGYCITLYSSQGKTYNNIHYVNNEMDRKALLKDGALYTLISRLKFDNKEKYENDIKKLNIKHKKDVLNF